MGLLRWMALAMVLAGLSTMDGQQASGAAQAGRPMCGPDHTAPSDADKAMLARKFADAERLYAQALAADPSSTVAMAGMIRATMEQGKLADALTLAMKDDSAHPNNAELLDALGEVRFRRGEVDEAARTFNRAVAANPCSGLTHYDMANYLHLAGYYGSAQRQLETAHTLAPDDPRITGLWKSTHAVPLTVEQRLEVLKRRATSPSLTAEQKDSLDAAIKGMEAQGRGNCELVTPMVATKLPITPISSGFDPWETMYEAALELKINGKKKRLEIDTGASGLVLTHSAAKAAGLVPEAQVKAGGVGDGGMVTAEVSHVDDIKVGELEFKNCMVQVLPAGNMLERLADIDGLIGPDVFRNYLVTLDVPGGEVRLGPLPQRPDASPAVDTFSLSTTEDEETPLSTADRAKDRYVAPEMKDWTPVFRAQHMLIVPTYIGSAPVKLFLIDTGAQKSMISPAAAREVTQVSSFTNAKVVGINGEVQNMLVADKVSITFAHVTQMNRGLQSFDFSGVSRSAGVDISGIIGFPMLSELVISIDYRDDLIHVTYDPRKGHHARN
jgi:tetratricopeptide (TPR) repeat protein